MIELTEVTWFYLAYSLRGSETLPAHAILIRTQCCDDAQVVGLPRAIYFQAATQTRSAKASACILILFRTWKALK